MNFEQFESNARLYVLGALNEEETADFEAARQQFGERAETVIAECYRLSAAFALSLRPTPPNPKGKQQLLNLIHETLKNSNRKPNLIA